MAPFDTDMVAFAEKELQAHGVELMLGDGVAAFIQEPESEHIQVALNGGRIITADLIILAIGVQPDTVFLRDSGLALGPRGHILVDEHMQTNIEHVYAVGDAVEVMHYINRQKTAIPLAGPANKQGRIVADRICGLDAKYKGTQGTAIIKIFELTAASTGFNERALKAAGVPYHVVHVHPNSHAGYYPGASQISLKLIFSENGDIYGAQAMGKEGVDKRIDVIATVIRMGGTVDDLTELELCYAPPFSSAKDPVNIAGFAAQNILTGLVSVVTPEQLLQPIPDDVDVIDVRSTAEHQRGAIPHSRNIPVDELRGRLDEIDSAKEIWVYCQVGFRGYVAARILRQHGLARVKNVSGGYKSYSMLS
jgi:rhodanese-related sulfurtransferase